MVDPDRYEQHTRWLPAAARQVEPVDDARDLAARPQAMPASAWLLPDPSEADADGVVGVGADLDPATLVDAYRRGIFPWPHPGMALPWFSPDPRGVIPVTQVRLSRSLRHRLRRCGWTTTVDRAFSRVIAACAQDRGDGQGSWITPPMIQGYTRLHELGWAHSLEVWDGDELVGGIYGVQIGGVFTGESMFHAVSDASKAALVDLVSRFHIAGGQLLDVQLTTPHLASLGARDVARPAFLASLHAARDLDVRLPMTTCPVDRLVVRPAT